MGDAVAEVGRELGPAVRWVRFEWDQPNLIGVPSPGLDGATTVFLYEFSPDGDVLRAVELMGYELVPVGASSQHEFWEAQEYRRQPATARTIALERRFGAVPEGTEADWGDYPHVEISQQEFDAEWRRSRAHLRDRPGSEHFA